MAKYKFMCALGVEYASDTPHCLFCDHCTDIFYDCNGPYMAICGLHHKQAPGKPCEDFQYTVDNEKKQ